LHRRDYRDDPTLCDRVFELLGTWIPALPVMRERAEGYGDWRWEEVSTPFVHERDGRIVSHVGVLEMDLVCHGAVRRVGGIHAVCTLASERRRGLYRKLMEEALAWCDERYATLELSTGNPEYYEAFGFRAVPEQRFVARIDSPGGAGFRALDLSRADDVAVLDDLLERRAPVAPDLGVVRERAVFKFNLGGGASVHYSEDLDLLAVWSHAPGEPLEVLDLVAATLPPFEAIAARLPFAVGEARFHFDPRSLGVQARGELVRDEVFMVRGDFPYGGDALPEGMLSPLARH
jgi:GNAT superfamily N-acetyltransferase